MTFEELFAFLQRPEIAAPICTGVILAIAMFMRRWKTSAVLAVVLIVSPFVGAAAAIADWAPTALFITMVAAVAAVAVYEGAWTPIYVGLMPIINWSFSAVPTLPIPEHYGGGNFQPLAIVTGLVLVVRDFAQREIKHWIFAAMIAGLLLSTLTSWIVIIFASAAAFLISETADWAVYTFVKRPLSQRVLLSSCASGPLDQLVFIWLASMAPGQAGIFAWGTILTGVASKLLGALIVSRVMAAQERRGAAANEMKPA